MKRLNHKNYKWEVLALLWMAFLMNQADRQVFNTVLPAIRDALDLSDTSVGLIATIFNLFYAAMVPIGGWVGDRFSKKWVCTLSLLFWSIATLFTGYASGFIMLVLMRSVATGGGEAFFGPANYSLIGQYHTDTRARAMSIHQTAYYIGVVLAGWLAGLIADSFGWQYSFLIFGGTGIIWGIVMIFRLKDKDEDAADETVAGEDNADKNATDEDAADEAVAGEDNADKNATDEDAADEAVAGKNTAGKTVAGKNPEAVEKQETAEKPGFFEGFKTVFTTPTALMLTIGFSGLIFVLTGYLTWMPTYLHETFGQSLASAGFNSMFYTHIAAFTGVLIAGSLSDRLGRKSPKARMNLRPAGLIAGAPFIIMMGSCESLWLVYAGLAGFGFCRAFFDANTYTVLYDVTPSRLHASCSSVMIMVGFGVGALAPVVLGAMKESFGLGFAFMSLAGIWIICGLLMTLVASRSYIKDYNHINNK